LQAGLAHVATIYLTPYKEMDVTADLCILGEAGEQQNRGCIPSTKYSWDGFPERFVRVSTATE